MKKEADYRKSTRFLCPWDSPGKNLEWVATPSSGDLSNPGVEPGSPALQAGSLPFEPPEKPIENSVR